MNKYIKKSSALILGASLLLGACGNEEEKTTDYKAVKTDVNEAIETAQKEVKGEVESISFGFDDKDKKWAYDVNLRGGNESHEITIDADTNKVLNKESEKENDKFTPIQYKDVTPVEDVIEVAQKEFDGNVKEWSLDEDNGVVKYDIELDKDGKSKEFEIDGKTKKIIKQES
ncbi:PepSY domain-containing protein [Macrococcus animalis]|uniref:PepSY domain-containing protein n=1 Tax=Macrococcus animalis TaxID=3395467 RepID=UPI0039BEBF45